LQLYFFLVVIVSLSCGSLPAAEFSPLRAAGATAAMVGAWIILCHVGARLCGNQVRAEKLDPMLGADLLERQLAAFRWIGLAVVVLCLGGFGLARTLDSVPLVEASIFLQAIILLSPGLAITVGTWSAEHHYGVMLEYTEGGLGNHAASVWQSFRNGIAWLIVPVLMLFGLSDVIGVLPLTDEVVTWLTAVTILLLVPLGLPWLIRHLFKTSPLSQPTDRWIGQLMTAVGLRRTRAVRWNTEGRSFNAMVAGFVPPLRTLLLSDRLVDELPRQQIAMVVLHEAAHLRRRHVPIRMLAVLPAWGAGFLVTKIAGQQSWAVAAGSVVGISLTMLILRIVAYRTEHDADVQACRLAVEISPQLEDVPASYEAASEALSAALIRVTFDHPAARTATWLHPGVAERVAWMRRQREVPTSNNTTAATAANPA
jgi:Zn-dependent protease with chaperone function